MQNHKKLKLVWNTVRHMTLRQWTYRLYYTARDRLPARQVKLPTAAHAHPLPPLQSAQPDLSEADAILQNRFFTVSGHVEAFDREIDWDLTGCDYRLRSFRLNSFAFLRILSNAYYATGNREYIEKGFSLIANWQSRCGSCVRGDKWNAYVIAQRLLNQIYFLSAHADKLPPDAYAPLIAAQARVLSKNIEYQLGANHLLTEGNALMHAGAFLQDRRLYRKGKKLLDREFSVQFLPDGGHCERSVSYHTESLQQYFEAVYLMHHTGDPDRDTWIRRLQRPYAFLNAMVQSDGHIPTVNDAALDYPFDAVDFLYTAAYLFDAAPPHGVLSSYSRRFALSLEHKQAANWHTPALLRDTGFLSARFGEHSLFLDAGDNGPEYNLGHAHADSLSILWTAGQQPVFADSGVYTYAPGEARNACRATAAHNTVEIDGTNSCQVWAAFRTARRGHTTVEDFTENESILRLTASHDGYCKVLPDPVCHRRSLSLDKTTGLLTLTDTLIPRAQSHSAVLRFHLAPSCQAVQPDSHTVLLAGKYRLRCSQPLTLEPCRIALRFGIPEESLCITVPFQISGETQISTEITLSASS